MNNLKYRDRHYGNDWLYPSGMYSIESRLTSEKDNVTISIFSFCWFSTKIFFSVLPLTWYSFPFKEKEFSGFSRNVCYHLSVSTGSRGFLQVPVRPGYSLARFHSTLILHIIQSHQSPLSFLWIIKKLFEEPRRK